MPNAAPICLFLFDRPEHLARTLDSLLACDGFGEAPVYVFGDGPKRPEQASAVEAARSIARQKLGSRASFHFSPVNMGLARSIIEGVTGVIRVHGRAVVVEDDLDLGRGFLTFMNAALERYAEEERVFQVSGHAFDAPELSEQSNAVFLPFIGTWGWGTWQRAWDQFDETASGWESLGRDKALRKRFNLGGVYDYATMMERQMEGARDSWGIRWYWTVFTRGGLVLYPPRTLVRNTGMDGTGSHGRGIFRHYGEGRTRSGVQLFDLPAPKLDNEAFAAVQSAIWRQNGGLAGKFVDTLKRLRIFGRRIL